MRGDNIASIERGAAALDILSGREWEDPLPLVTATEAAPYPLDALPEVIRDAVAEVRHFVQAPVPLIASSALAAVSLATQAYVDVRRAERLQGPSSLFLLTVADSGERKSTCDGLFTAPIREYEQAQAEDAKPQMKKHAAELAAWESEREGLLASVKAAAKSGKATAPMREALTELEWRKPPSVRVPRLVYGDATPEALCWSLAKVWPSGGILSSEAGAVFGAHGMGKDSVMRNLAVLNVLWDGGVQTFDRRKEDGSFTVRGARLTVALQIQEATLRSFFERSGSLARGSGFLARFLVAWPTSTQGSRLFIEPPATTPALAAFHRCLAAILERPAPIDDDGVLSPAVLALTPEAKEAWRQYHDEIEIELTDSGALRDVRDVASKSADNAARLAALFAVCSESSGSSCSNIESRYFEGASRIAAWHLNESRRFFGEIALSPEQTKAARLDDWLIEHCMKHGVATVASRTVIQYGPTGVRSKQDIDACVAELTELNRARVVIDGKKRLIKVNPALLGLKK